jgi:microcystin-dependent protein
MKATKIFSAAAMLLAASAFSATAQVGVNTIAPDSSALLDIRYSGAGSAVGVLLPHLSAAERAAKKGAVSNGMLVFDRSEKQLYYFDSALGWVAANPMVSVHSENGFTDIRPQNAAVNSQNMSLGLDSGEAATAKLDVNGSARIRGDLKVDKNIVAQDTVKASVLEGLGAIPVGGIIMWSGTNVPIGWTLCNGQTSNGYKTPDLRGRFIVGYGANGNNLPANVWDSQYVNPGNLSEKGAVVGNTNGEMLHTLSQNEIPAHNHAAGTLTANTAGEHSHLFKGVESVDADKDIGGAMRDVKRRNRDGNALSEYGGETDGAHSHTVSGSTGNTGGGNAHENRPPYYVLAFIMRVR